MTYFDGVVNPLPENRPDRAKVGLTQHSPEVGETEEGLSKEGEFDLVTTTYPTISSGVHPQAKSQQGERQEESHSGVQIGNVSGGIHDSIIAGRDAIKRTITVGGQPSPLDKEPTVAEVKQLLTEIQQELAEITAQQAALKEISPAAPFTAQGAAQSVKEAAEKIEAELKPDEVKSVQQSLTEATTLLSGILDGAKTVAEKSTEVGQAVKPIADHLTPLVEKLGQAALWVGKLWLLG